MLLNVDLSQANVKGDVTFNASKKINTGKAENLLAIANEVSGFCIAFRDLVKRNHKRGWTGLKGIRKSQVMTLTIQGIGDDDDINIQLSFRNFGKFLEETTRKNLQGLLDDNINFIETHGDWSS